MMKALARLTALALLLLAVCGQSVFAESADALQKQKQAASDQRDQLRQSIEALQARLQKKDAERKRASDALRQSELAISDATRRLKELSASLEAGQRRLGDIQTQIKARQAALEQDRQVLGQQLRAQYSSSLSPWSAVLSGRDPQSLGQELGYLSFISAARVATIERLRQGIKELSGLEQDLTNQQELLAQQQSTVEHERKNLNVQRKQRAKLLAELEGSIAAERAERDRLKQDEIRLGELVQGLGQQLEKLQADARHARAIREEVLASLPQGEGIKRGVPMPIKGPVLARFGSKRPDGGDWRGVLIGAHSGEPVKAVAAGTVVYATWLRGFGNLIIVDHGDEFLTVYAHNDSLLKEVGQKVRGGDVIANAGNTGGQLDSALYFEVRHRGVPLDPLLYLGR